MLRQIVAVIFCNTGIALLAYMDGIVKTSTLGGVVLGSAAAAGSAVYKVRITNHALIDFREASLLQFYL
jgi:hypothetical protein